MLVKAYLERGAVASWACFSCVSVVKVAGDNVFVDVGNEESCGFGGYLAVDALLEGVKLCVGKCEKGVEWVKLPNGTKLLSVFSPYWLCRMFNDNKGIVCDGLKC